MGPVGLSAAAEGVNMFEQRDMHGIWVFVETYGGRAKDAGLELLTAARPLAVRKNCGLTAVIIGNDVLEAAGTAFIYGADHVILIDDPACAFYCTDVFAPALAHLVRKYGPDTLIISATNNGRDLAPRVACSLRTGLTADCTGIDIDDETGNIAWTRPTFGGNLMATIMCPDNRPQMGTVRPGVFRKQEYRSGGNIQDTGRIIRESLPEESCSVRTRLIREIDKIGKENDLAEARIIVSGGRGMGTAENFRLLYELAEVLGGSVGCSRAVVENGWMPQSAQIGQSGKTVSPRLYFAIGISGAIQHLAGISGAERIIAVNKDESAPIFDAADYGIVGDLNEIVPLMTERFRRRKD